MKDLARHWRWAALFLGTLALGLLFSRSESPSAPSVPSVREFGPRGFAALKAWLDETQGAVQVLDESLEFAPEALKGLASLVLVQPRHRALTEGEVATLKRFVRQGGALIYFAQAQGAEQPALDAWLELSTREESLPVVDGAFDVGGTSLPITHRIGLFSGVGSVRTSLSAPIQSTHPSAVALDEHSVAWVMAEGQGFVWALHDTGLGENARVGQADNLAFWAQVKSLGPVGFAQRYFHPELVERSRAQAGLWAAFFVTCVAVVMAWGRRLGPARPVEFDPHRSSLDYLDAMAGLLKRARADDELCVEAVETTRRELAERLGLSPRVAWAELGPELLRRFGTGAEDATLLAQGSRDFLRISRAAARLVKVSKGPSLR